MVSKEAAAAAIANPNQDNTDLQYDGSFSVLHEGTGLNLTMSAGCWTVTTKVTPPTSMSRAGG